MRCAKGRCCLSAADRAAEAERWLRFAREDIAAAEAMLASQHAKPRHACWLAQQAAEKAIKAALVREGIDFPKSHDLERLASLLAQDPSDQRRWDGLSELSEWAVEARYPGEFPEPTLAEAEQAVRWAATILDDVAGMLRG